MEVKLEGQVGQMVEVEAEKDFLPNQSSVRIRRKRGRRIFHTLSDDHSCPYAKTFY